MLPDGTLYILALNGVICLSGVLLCVLVMIRERRLLLMPMGLAFFLVTNGLTQGAPLWIDLGVNFPTDPIIYQRATAIDAIILTIALPCLFILGCTSPGSEAPDRPLGIALLAVITAFAAGASGYFLIRNWEVLPLVERLYSTSNYYEYINLRNQIGDVINGHSLSGTAPASWAHGVWCPFLFWTVPDQKRINRGLRLVWLGIIAAAMWVPAVIVGSRLMLLLAVAIPLLAFVSRRFNLRHVVRHWAGAWRPLLGALGLTVAGAYVFQYFYHGTFLESLVDLGARALGAPAAVSGCYYYAFPEYFPFRGWLGILKFPMVGDSVDFHLVSLAATGLDSNANGSFAATAYSGAGFAGVAVAAAVVFVFATWLDGKLRRLPRRLANAVGFSNVIPASVLGSAPALTAMATFGFLLGPLVIVVLLTMFRDIPPWRPAETPRNPPLSS